jgi:hypothetical protein
MFASFSNEWSLEILELILPDKKDEKPYKKGVEESYSVKKVSDVPVPSRDVTNHTLLGQE